MSTFAVIAAVVVALLVVAALVLILDIGQGALGGGRRTLARARRLLVISTDAATEEEARRWADEQRRKRPELECFQLHEPEDEAFLMKVHEAMERHRPDAVVVVRHAADRHGGLLEGMYGTLKDNLSVPVDAIYVGEGGKRG